MPEQADRRHRPIGSFVVAAGPNALKSYEERLRLTPECGARRLGMGLAELGLGLVEPAEPEEHEAEVETDGGRMGKYSDERTQT